MREPLKDRIRLVHIQDAINNINQYIDGKTLQELNSNFLVHDYYRIDYKEVWKVFHEDLPPLRMKKRGYGTDEISKITGLSRDEIEWL